MNRPPAKAWQTFDSVPAGGQDVTSPYPRLHMLGVSFHGDGNFVAVPSASEDGKPVTLAVKAGQFWPLEFSKVDPTSTALPLTVLWGPLR
jgi:hypothetical protein